MESELGELTLLFVIPVAELGELQDPIRRRGPSQSPPSHPSRPPAPPWRNASRTGRLRLPPPSGGPASQRTS